MSRLRPSIPWFRLAPVVSTGIQFGGSSTDNAIVRWDGTGGSLVQNSVVTIADTTGAIDGPLSIHLGTAGSSTGKITMSGSTSGTVTIQTANAAGTYTLTLPTTDGNANETLTTDGNGVLSWSTAGSGDVTAAATITDNAIVRGDGGAKGVQESVVLIGDTGAVSAALSYAATGAGNKIQLTTTTDNASVQVGIFEGDRATMADNDEAYFTLRLSDDAGTQKEVARITWAIPDVNAGTNVDGRLDFSVMTAGTLAKELQLSGADLSPSTNDGLALGTTDLSFSDLFLASGAVINYASSDVVITHSAGILTMGTGELRITTAGTNAASVITVGSTSTLTNKTLTSPVINTGTIGTSLVPTSDDGAALGSATNRFSDLWLAEGGIINWNAGDVTITHQANRIDFAGASSGYAFDASIISQNATTSQLTIQNQIFTAGQAHIAVTIAPSWTAENFDHHALVVQASQAGTNSGLLHAIKTQLEHTGAGALADGTHIHIDSTTISAGTVTNIYGLKIDAQTGGSTASYGIYVANADTYSLWIDAGVSAFGGNVIPDTNDVAALGTTALGWSDLHLATGGVINWANGEITLTETDSNTLTFAGGVFVVPTNGLTINATNVTSTGTQLNYLNAATGTTGTTSTNVVFSTSPTLVTPTLGVASATTINKVTLTAPATGSTLTIADGKTLIVNNSVTIAGTDSTTMTFPATSASVARTDAAQTFTGTQTFSQVLTTSNAIAASGNAATVPITSKINTVTNNSAATLTITMTTTSATDGQVSIVRILDASAVAQTITWVNTENSGVSAPTTSNGSTTLPLTVGFQYNSGTSKWRCVASA